MAMKPRLTTVARAHGKHCLHIVRDAMTDPISPGYIDEREAPTVLRLVENWYARDVVADEAGGLSQAIERGAETESYIEGKLLEFKSALDGLPLSIA